MTAAKKLPQPGHSPQVRHVEIHPEQAGQRLDNFLISCLKGVPKTHIYRLVRKGEVRINKGRCKPDYRLQEGDIVRIPPVRMQAPAQATRTPASPEQFAWLAERILYEDDGLLIINKPSGLAVHGGSGISLGLIEALRRMRPDARFLELAHRLDRETSGCIVIAKKRACLLGLHSLLRENQVDKRYLALLQGLWTGKGRRVEASLEKYHLQSGERLVNVSEEGKAASSRFTPRQRYKAPESDNLLATLMEIKLLTGRTHQARVHAAHVGQPIAGDEKYGDKDFNRQLRALGLTRLFLHAASLNFIHPSTGKPLRIEAPMPDDLQTLLEKLRPV